MLMKKCDLCGKEEIVNWEDYVYSIDLGSNRLGFEEVDDAKEILGKDGFQQTKQICEKCIKKLGFMFNKQRNVKK
jgi:hypothetical protein